MSLFTGISPVGPEDYPRMGFEVVGRSELDSNGKPYPLLHMRAASANEKR